MFFLFLLCQWYKLEPHAENTFLVIVADDFENTNFRGVFYVEPDAKALVVIAYMHHTDGFRGSFRQTLHVESAHCFLLRDELHTHREVLSQGFIDYFFDFCNLCFGWRF